MTAVIDLSQLPLPDAVEELDAETIVEEMLDALALEDPQLAGITETDPAYHVIQVCAAREVMLRARINDAVRAALLPTSWGTNLEHHGALEEVERLTLVDAEGNETAESDEDYKQRIFLAARSSGAGVQEAYETAALAVDSRVASVLARSPSPAVVHIEWVPQKDTDPGDYAEIQAAMVAEMTSDDVKMLADSVTVTQASAVTQDVTALLQLAPGPDPELAKTNAEEALVAWADAQRVSRYPLPLSGIMSALTVEGVVGVVMTTPLADLSASASAEYYELGTVTLTTEVAPWLA